MENTRSYLNESVGQSFKTRSAVYAVGPRQRISKDANLGGQEGEEHKEQSDGAEDGKRRLGRVAGGRSFFELPCFVEVRHRRRDEENGDIDPVGGFSDDTVVGVKENGDQPKTKQRSLQLHTPKVLLILEE